MNPVPSTPGPLISSAAPAAPSPAAPPGPASPLGSAAGAPAPAPPPATTPPEAPKPDARPDMAARIAAEQQKRQVEALRKEVEALRSAAEEAKSLKAWRETLRSNPGAALKEAFGDKWYDVITDTEVNGGRLTPEQVDAKLEARLAEYERSSKERTEAERAAAAKQATEEREAWVAEVGDHLKASPSYRLVNMHGAQRAVAEHIERHYQATGRLLSNEEGAKEIEATLRKAILDSIDDAMYQEILKSRQPAQAGAARAGPQFSALHGGMTSGTPASPRLSLEERKREAYRKLEELRAAKGG